MASIGKAFSVPIKNWSKINTMENLIGSFRKKHFRYWIRQSIKPFCQRTLCLNISPSVSGHSV
ncbi:Uncharacterised protein [Mycobacteroides abscessus subsp. abscessus]|nr:Uncharacterised protein [Mycobacteroides abscessus subsp. abscessus]